MIAKGLRGTRMESNLRDGNPIYDAVKSRFGEKESCGNVPSLILNF
jgi:hypothetical protein